MKPQSNIIRQNSLLIIFPATACSIKYISYLIKPFKLIEIPEASNVLSIVSKNLIKKQITILKATRVYLNQQYTGFKQCIVSYSKSIRISDTGHQDIRIFH